MGRCKEQCPTVIVILPLGRVFSLSLLVDFGRDYKRLGFAETCLYQNFVRISVFGHQGRDAHSKKLFEGSIWVRHLYAHLPLLRIVDYAAVDLGELVSLHVSLVLLLVR